MCRLLVVQQERLIERMGLTGQSVPCPWRVLRVHPCQPLQYPKVLSSAVIKVPEYCLQAACTIGLWVHLAHLVDNIACCLL